MTTEAVSRHDERAIEAWAAALGIPARWARQYVYERGSFPTDLATFTHWLELTGKRDPITGVLRVNHRSGGK